MIDALDRLVLRSKRATGIALPHTFLRDEVADETTFPPLARLLVGGGEVRIKLLLTANLVAVSAPYLYDRMTPASSWAAALGLPASGGRRVSAAFTWLQQNLYLRLTDPDGHPLDLEATGVRGRPAAFYLRNLDGSGKRYTRPRKNGRYMKVPQELWSKHWIMRLTAPELVVLLVLLDGQRGRRGTQSQFMLSPARYGIQSDSWTRGVAGLKESGLIEVVSEVVAAPGKDWLRRRNLYRVCFDKLETDAYQDQPAEKQVIA